MPRNDVRRMCRNDREEGGGRQRKSALGVLMRRRVIGTMKGPRGLQQVEGVMGGEGWGT